VFVAAKVDSKPSYGNYLQVSMNKAKSSLWRQKKPVRRPSCGFSREKYGPCEFLHPGIPQML
jgi:hypothetical protein